MKAFNNRHYDIEIILPTPQTQKIMVGTFIRRTIGKGLLNVGPDALPIRTFRVRKGNGYAGTILGELIQDQYDYFVPDSINNPEGETARIKFTAAVAAWQALTDNERSGWNYLASKKGLHMAGYNLYIRKYMLNEL